MVDDITSKEDLQGKFNALLPEVKCMVLGRVLEIFRDSQEVLLDPEEMQTIVDLMSINPDLTRKIYEKRVELGLHADYCKKFRPAGPMRPA